MRKQLILIWLLSSLSAACITIKPVEFRRAENFSVSANNNNPLLNFGLVFYNPNHFGCTIAEIKTEGSMKNQQLFTAGFNTGIKAKRNSEFTIPVTARIEKMDVSRLLGAGINLILNSEAIPLKVNGKIRLKKCFLKKSYPFDYTQAIDKGLLKKFF